MNLESIRHEKKIIERMLKMSKEVNDGAVRFILHERKLELEEAEQKLLKGQQNEKQEK